LRCAWAISMFLAIKRGLTEIMEFAAADFKANQESPFEGGAAKRRGMWTSRHRPRIHIPRSFGPAPFKGGPKVLPSTCPPPRSGNAIPVFAKIPPSIFGINI